MSSLRDHTPQSVLNQLKEQAERKAALKMFYSAADVFREYKGPYATETATERAQLAEEYDNRARVAEIERWGEDAAPPPTKPVENISPSSAPKPPPSTPRTPAAPSPPRPKLEVVRPRPAPAASSGGGASSTARIEGGQVTFDCRWCKEPITTEAANAGKLVPCPKCDLLVTIPKVKK